MIPKCSGCPLAARGLKNAREGNVDAAISALTAAVERTPTLAPAWRSLVSLEMVNPRNDFAKQTRFTKEAARSSLTAALCVAGVNGTVDEQEAARAIMRLYHDVDPALLCRAIRTKHARLARAEVATLGLGSSLCDFPGMDSTNCHTE